jgi:hypothetical protein
VIPDWDSKLVLKDLICDQTVFKYALSKMVKVKHLLDGRDAEVGNVAGVELNAGFLA